jgi:hypothetical protein
VKREVLERIETEVKALNDKLDRKQVLDLTWAIWGSSANALARNMSGVPSVDVTLHKNV